MKATAAEKSWLALEQDTDPAQFERLSGLAREMATAGNQEAVYAILHLLGNRWGGLILLLLATGHLRYAALRRALHALSGEKRITPRVLTMKLRELEQHRLIERSASDDVPPKVDYSLTTKGRELTHHTRTIIEWANGALRAETPSGEP